MEVSKCMGLGRALCRSLRLRLCSCIRGVFFEACWVSFMRRPSKVLLPVLGWSTAIGIDVMYGLRVIALVVIVTGSCNFVWFCILPLLLELAKMLNLRLVHRALTRWLCKGLALRAVIAYTMTCSSDTSGAWALSCRNLW
jgi:hypothetical protein